MISSSGWSAQDSQFHQELRTCELLQIITVLYGVHEWPLARGGIVASIRELSCLGLFGV